MQSYRRLFALPGVRSVLVLMFFARIPSTAAGMTLTLHVAVGMGRGYGAAGLVGAAGTIGIAIGAPLMGRIVDDHGLRRMVLITVLGEAVFWFLAPTMSYPVLLIFSFVAGLVVLPAMSIGRQAITALVPEDQRRTALSLDAIGVELTFMVGPALAVLLCTQFSTDVALIVLGGQTVVAGLAVYLVNPPVRAEHERDEERPPRSTWLTPRFIAVLVAAVGTVFVLAGTEVALVAHLRGHGELDWTGAVIAVMCVASAIGGLIHGGVRRSLGQLPLLIALSALLIPVGWAGAHWWVIALALIPSNLACAPAITATGEDVARLAPASARGEAMGLQGSAFTVGAAVGAPMIGFVVDHAGSAWGFVVSGAGGLLVAALAFVLNARDRARVPREPVPASG